MVFLMIYGRRHQNYQDKRQVHHFFGKQTSSHAFFRLKYALLISASSVVGTLLFSGPALWFLTENYQIFRKLSLVNSPELLPHLERESTWLFFFFAIGLLTSLALSVYIGFKIANKILDPVQSVQIHLENLTIGNWRAKQPNPAQHDDLYEFMNIYLYFLKFHQ